MYVLTINDKVVLGPINWNSKMFNSEIEEATGVDPKLFPSDENNVPLNLDNGVQIRKCIEVRPSLNSKIEMFNGPFWTYTDTLGIATYTVNFKPLDLIKGDLKNVAAAERYKKEIAGVTATIQNQEVTIDTARGVRDIFVQKFLLMGDTDTVQWKFPEGWLNLTKSDLGLIVQTGANYIQEQFEWEQLIVNQIDAATTPQELDAIVIVEPVDPTAPIIP